MDELEVLQKSMNDNFLSYIYYRDICTEDYFSISYHRVLSGEFYENYVLEKNNIRLLLMRIDNSELLNKYQQDWINAEVDNDNEANLYHQRYLELFNKLKETK